MELRDYGKLFLRRKWLIVFTVLSILFGASVYCVVTPELYKSSISILVIPQTVPEDYVRSTISAKLEQQLVTIKQQVMSRTTMTKVMDELHLFEKERTTLTSEELFENMRKRIEIEVVQGQPREGSQAFTLSFLHESPREAMRGAARLASLFIDENLKTREQQAVGTSDFLESQLRGTKAKLEPDKDWNGEEAITFTATDKSNAKASVEVKIIVNPVNDAPVVSTITPSSDPTIDETKDGTEKGLPGIQKFSIVASDVDKDALSYNWTIEDEEGNVYAVEEHLADYTFTANFDCDFENGKFCGGDSSKTYYVVGKVTDNKVDVEAKKWYLTVKNVNRAPIIAGIEVFTVAKDGVTATPLIEKSLGNYSVGYGKMLRFDVTNKVTDLDVGIENGQGTENLEKLSFEWTSNIGGSFGSTAKTDVGAGKKTSTVPLSLKGGKTHIITIRVTDSDQASDTFTITVKVGKKTDGPGFEGIIVVAAIVAVAAVVGTRYRK